jgi:uncharacterized protein with ATP-grasp and redox domains
VFSSITPNYNVLLFKIEHILIFTKDAFDMKPDLNCGTCMINQALSSMETRDIDPKQQLEILKSLVIDIAEHLDQPTPSHFHTILLHRFSEYMQIPDIYAEDKKKQNEIASKLVPVAKNIIEQSQNPLYTAAYLAVEGNSIDQLFFSESDLKSKVNYLISHHFTIDHFQDFKTQLKRSNKIVYLLDNAGEVFFDKLFIEFFQDWRRKNGLPDAEVTCVVKGGPILNDATMEDAIAANLGECATVLSSGTDHLGCALEKVDQSTRDIISSAHMIISKGQANFETIEDNESL